VFCSLEHFNSYNLLYLAINALHFTVHYIVVRCLQTFAFKNVRRTVQKMLQILMFLNFNGFIWHRTFVVCLSRKRKKKLYFWRLIFFFGVFLLIVLLLSATQQAHRKYIRLKAVLAAKRFSVFFYKVRTNCDPTKPYNKSIINLACSVCTGKYCLRFLSHRPRSFVARSVRKTTGNTFPYRPRSRLISP
jgi:hypothetical protein